MIVLRVLSIKIDIVEEALIRRYVAAAARLRGCAVLLCLPPSSDVVKAGDNGAWITCCHQPRALFLHHTMDDLFLKNCLRCITKTI